MPLHILCGPPGSGKTTVIQKLRDCVDFYYISVGEIYRKEIAADTTFSIELKKYIEAGLEYPNDVIERLIRPYINNISEKETVILDGFPRYLREVSIFKSLLSSAKNKISIGTILKFNIDYETALTRVQNRYVCIDCDFQSDKNEQCLKCGSKNIERRKDDEKSTFKNRYDAYDKSSKEVIDSLKLLGFKVINIDANQNKNNVFLQTKAHILLCNQQNKEHKTSPILENIEIISTIDHYYVSPPIRLLDGHNILYNINNNHKVMVLNWDVSLPNERTYRYDMQIDLGLIGKRKNLFLINQDNIPAALQKINDVDFNDYEKELDNALNFYVINNLLSQEQKQKVKLNYNNLREFVFKNINKDIFTKEIITRINKLIDKEDVSKFISKSYEYYYKSRIMSILIPQLIKETKGKKSIYNLMKNGVFSRNPFRSMSDRLTNDMVNNPDYFIRNVSTITEFIRNSEIIPSVEVLYWTIELMNKLHFGNDYGFYKRYEEYLGIKLYNQITEKGQDGESYIQIKRDYGLINNGKKLSSKNSANCTKNTRINSIIGVYCLIGDQIKSVDIRNDKKYSLGLINKEIKLS